MKNMPALFALLMLVSSLPSISVAGECPAIPAVATVPVDELITRSARIVLVAVVAGRSTETLERSGTGRIRIDLEAERQKVTESGFPGDDRVDTSLRLAQLDVIENLKGGGPVALYRASSSVSEAQHDFNAHTLDAFWDDPETGLVAYDAECRAVMQFEPGKRYLVFEGPAHVKGAELIESDEDAWLAYVRKAMQ